MSELEQQADVLDLDALTAAAGEVLEKPKTLRFRGHEFTLPPKMPFRLIDKLERVFALRENRADDLQLLGAYTEAVRIALGPEYDRFIEICDPDIGVMQTLIVELPKMYATTAGESQASDSSSERTGSRSRPTSNGSTDSTSAEPVSVPTH